MPSFSDTVELERVFLKHLTSNSMMARLYMHRITEDMFTSEERQFIYVIAAETLKNSKAILTRTIFEYEVGTKISDKEATYFISEWNLVEGLTATEHPDALLVKLGQARVGRKALTITEDVVGLLQAGDIEKAVSHLKREAMGISSTKEIRSTVELTDYDRRLKTIYDKKLHPEKYMGIKIGFPTFDQRTGGLFPGELTLLAGVTGVGKSTICRQICKNIAILNGKNVLHIANEEYLEQVEHKYDAIYVNIPYSDFKLATISDEEIERWKSAMIHLKNTNAGRVFIKEVPAFTDVSLVEQAYRELENKGIPIHAIVIDHLPHIVPIEKAWGENDERGKAASDCKELARWLRLPVIIPTQAATEVEDKQTKGHRAGKLDVYGSKAQIHVANTFFIITDKGKDPNQQQLDEWKRDVYWLVDVKKNRDGPTFHFVAKHFVNYGEVKEVDDDPQKAAIEAAEDHEAAVEKEKEEKKAKSKMPDKKYASKDSVVESKSTNGKASLDVHQEVVSEFVQENISKVYPEVVASVNASLEEEEKENRAEEMSRVREKSKKDAEEAAEKNRIGRNRIKAIMSASIAAQKKVAQ